MKRFLRDDSGAVTVDWVVLTAFMAGFGFAVASIISTAARDPADGLGAQLSAMEIQR
jgi:Flp pilus assembly pilin Flp